MKLYSYSVQEIHPCIYNIGEKNTKLDTIQYLSNILQKDRKEWRAACIQVMQYSLK